MPTLTRRDWIRSCAAVPLVAATATGVRAADAPIRFGFSLYGMKSMPLADAVRTCAEVGYSCVEFALMPGYPTDPAAFPAADRIVLRKQLADANLSVAALMENLREPADDAKHRANLDRLKNAVELGRALSPTAPPVIESVLGGKATEWDALKDRMADRLRAWAAIGKEGGTVIAVKPHVGNALHTPDACRWLVKEVNSPWLRLTYDHSHFVLQGMTVADTAAALLPESAFVHIKDAKGTAAKFEFVLPGDGDTDYRAFAAALRKVNYTGAVVAEPSAQLFNKPGYDPVAAAKSCYAKLAPAFGLKG